MTSVVNVVDPRIESEAPPVYLRTIAPKQNQFYKIPASGKSNSNLTFNNLTTLGADRAFLDTFELELTCKITFVGDAEGAYKPAVDEWTFDSFPFSKCCESIRANVNGGYFMSQPLSYLRAKERYWNDDLINKSYGNICPCNKPHMQNEMGANFSAAGITSDDIERRLGFYNFDFTEVSTEMVCTSTSPGAAWPTRTSISKAYNMPCASGIAGSENNSIVRTGGAGSPNYQWKQNGKVLEVIVTWREPVFCPPFSTRIDATFGRPLYNITSIDLAFNMQDLGNMIRIIRCRGNHYVASYSVDILSAQLCYQVETMPPGMARPANTIIPYRSFVPYITDFPENPDLEPAGRSVTMRSGVYTINEVPTAIWIFGAPTKNIYQTNPEDSDSTKTGLAGHGCWASNKLFTFLKHISISMANTTQILNTADLPDLYRIAKNNGCQDTFKAWGINDGIEMRLLEGSGNIDAGYLGPGSVLRLVPGTDIVLPEQELIPGTNANNMVFQVEATFDIPQHSPNLNSYALWVLFEYVGVARLSPGQCEITMNPLANGEGFRSAPTVSAPTALQPTVEGEAAEGAGFWDKVKNFFKKAADGVSSANKFLKDKKIVSGVARGLAPVLGNFNPMAGVMASNIADTASNLGYGEMGLKRARGGAVMGLGDFT